MQRDPARSAKPEPIPAGDNFDLQLADCLVHDIFSVSLTLSSAQSLTEGLASVRLGQAIDDLDGLVRQLHDSAFTARCANSGPPRPISNPLDDAHARDIEPAPIERAASALSQVEHVLIALWADTSADTALPEARDRIIEATRLVRSAMITLDARAVR